MQLVISEPRPLDNQPRLIDQLTARQSLVPIELNEFFWRERKEKREMNDDKTEKKKREKGFS